MFRIVSWWLLLITITTPAWAVDNEFSVRGSVTLNGRAMPEVLVRIYKNTLPYKSIKSDASGNFELQLDVNNIYLLEFDKEGYYPLKVNISTMLPEDKAKKGVTGEFDLLLELVPAFPGLEAEVLNSPIAQIKYNQKTNKFDYDTDYFEFIRKEVEKLYEAAGEMESRGAKPDRAQKNVKKFKPPVVEVTGRLFSDDKSQKPLAGYEVGLYDEATRREVAKVVTDSTGTFRFTGLSSDSMAMSVLRVKDLPEGAKHVFLANSAGVSLKKMSVDREKRELVILPAEVTLLTIIQEEDPWIKPVRNLPESVTVIKEIINYKAGEVQVNDEAIQVLNKIVRMLQESPEAKLEIRSHTDANGTAEFNMNLSEQRAKACVAYVIAQGIDQSRVSGRGMGESDPVNYCTDMVECGEYLHRENRRTEFIISN